MKNSRTCTDVTRITIALFLFVASVVMIHQVFAHDFQAGDLTLVHPYTNPTSQGAFVASGYLVIENNGETDDRLIGISASFSQRAEIHQKTIKDNVVTKHRLEEGLLIPRNVTITLTPEDIYILFIGLDRQLKRGEQHEVTLLFERAGELKVEFEVDDNSVETD